MYLYSSTCNNYFHKHPRTFAEQSSGDSDNAEHQPGVNPQRWFGMRASRQNKR